MAYLTKEYYLDTFHGTAVEESQFDRLAQAASDIIDAIVLIPIDPDKHDMDGIAKAAAYQMEMLVAQGGIEAVVGLSSQGITSEQLGDYHVSGSAAGASSDGAAAPPSFQGIPISPITLAILRKVGLMRRWAFAPFYKWCKPPYEER